MVDALLNPHSYTDLGWITGGRESGGVRTRLRDRALRRGAGLRLSALPLALALLLLPTVSFAQVAPPPPPSAVASFIGPRLPGEEALAEIEAQRERTRADLARIENDIRVSAEASRRLDEEMAALATDAERIRQAAIQAAAEQKSASAEIAASEERVGALSAQEGNLRGSLRERRAVLAEVLAALQRMTRTPPPALLVRPNDALGSVRSAILLGAVVPELREETVALLGDLDRLVSLKTELAGEKERFAEALQRGRDEEARLARLLAEKQVLEAAGRGRLGDEQRRAAELGSQAASISELVATLDREAESARAKAEARRRLAADAAAARARAERDAAAASPPETAPEPTPDPAAPPAGGYDVAALREAMTALAPSAAFSTMKGSLVPPVAGRRLLGFGEADAAGRRSSGQRFAARPGDVVTAPADAHVLYSGPFRSYGQLLILDGGDGYHIVLAGMSRIDVSVGQFVLSGEPLATMGAVRVASAADADLSADVSLYVEFRKDGNPVDPNPWWAARSSGRTRNDT